MTLALAGGAADKLGNLYEGRWTVACLAEVLADRWESIELEPYDGFKIEFRGTRRSDGVAEHHQAKRFAPGGGNWTLGALERAGLLEAMKRWTETGREFVLVSTSQVVGGLPALATQARMAADLGVFLAGLSGEGEADLEALRVSLGTIAHERTWGLLRRIHLRQIDEETSRDRAVDRIALLVDGDPETAIVRLADHVGNHIGERLTATALWALLASAGFRRRDWGSDLDLRASVEHQCRRFVGDEAESKIRDLEAVREEALALIEHLTKADGGMVILSADAGMGKSVVVRQVVRELSRRCLVLPMRLDTLPASGRSDELGRHLGLVGSPSQVVAHLAADDLAVLVIDQLDAVSQVSGRYPIGFETVAEMLRESAHHTNIRVLLACRGFDLEADSRLRRLRDRDGTRIVTLGLLDDSFVDQVLEASGLDPKSLTEAQRSLVRVPLHLRLLGESSSGRPSFATALDLFDAYWTSKRLSVRQRGGDEANATSLVDELAAEMSFRERLEVPDDIGDRWPHELDILRSEHVLAGGAHSVRFFHEQFFDYAFARSFSRRNVSLATFLKSTGQGLFRRSQARQVLAYRRATDQARYLEDLRATLLDRSVRFHIKALVLQWIGTLPDPGAAEWAVLADALAGSDERLGRHALAVIADSPALFDLADGSGLISGWLASADEDTRDRTVRLIAQVQRRRPARAAALLGALDCTSERDRKHVHFAAQVADIALDESFFQFVLERIRSGCLDGIGWDPLDLLARKRPEWACRYIRTYLDRRLDLLPTPDEGDPFGTPGRIPDPPEGSLLVKVAAEVPAVFADEVLPLVLRLIERTRVWNDSEHRFDDQTWRWRWYGDTYGVAENLIRGAEEALRRLAESDPTRFAAHRASLESAVSSTADHLLARSFAAAPAALAADAAEWLFANPSRLEAGYMSASHWVGRELVEAIWPQLSAGLRTSLEQMILGYYPKWERSVAGHRAFGAAQFTILTALPRADLSAAGARRVDELRRKFGPDPAGPHGPEAGYVGSPVPREATAKMSDRHWLGAMARYARVEDRLLRPISRSGGARELGAHLGDATKAEPDRFARLACTLPDDLAAIYADAVLLGLHQAEAVSAEVVWQLARRLHALPGRPCGRYLCDVVAKTANDGQLPPDIAELVAWYATEDPDPLPGSERAVVSRDHGVRLGLLDVGINCTRGRAAHAMALALGMQPGLLDGWRGAIATMTGDESEGVRACVAGVLLAALRLDRDWVIRCALELFDGHEDVATSADGEKLIRLGVRTHPTYLLPVIDCLVASQNEAVARVGARLACLAAFALDEAKTLAGRALDGSAGARLGAAEVFSANVDDAALQAACSDALLRLFHDDDPDVRREAGTCFRAMVGHDVGGVEHLFVAFATSPGLTENAHDVLDALLASPTTPPDATVEVCRAVIAAAGLGGASIASGWSAQMPDVATLAARLHAFGDPAASEAALDLIDSLAANWAYGLDRAIAPFER